MLSWFPTLPRRTLSPLEKPTALVTVTAEAPIAVPEAVLVFKAPGETASTGMTVQ
jgi:hypothetical protein